MKEKGILLPIFSLPSKYGIGDLGKEAYDQQLKPRIYLVSDSGAAEDI